VDGQSDLAIDRGQRAVRLSRFDFPNYQSYNALAILLSHTGRYAEAHDALRSSVQLNPSLSVA